MSKAILTILAIDPGAHTGWAVRSANGGQSRYDSDVWENPHKDPKFVGSYLIAFRKCIADLMRKAQPNLVIMCLTFAKGWAGEKQTMCRGVVFEEATKRGVAHALKLPESSVKRYVAGSGNAPKNAVIAAVNKRLGLSITDDNEADAVALLLYYIDQEA